jgi:hypothetical protein
MKKKLYENSQSKQLLDPYHVFHVHQESILISKAVLNVQTVPLVTFNQNQSNKNVTRYQLEES